MLRFVNNGSDNAQDAVEYLQQILSNPVTYEQVKDEVIAARHRYDLGHWY